MANDEFKAEPKLAPGLPASGETPPPPFAWQPLTPRGVAAFATAAFPRVFLIELIAALLAASAITWFIASAWCPVVRAAIRQLPETGAIRGQELSSPCTSTEPLAESRFLAVVVNTADDRPAPSRADVRTEFHQNHFQLCSIFGCLPLNYPQQAEFNRPELEPLWGAWEPMLLGGALLGSVVFLVVCWALLATLYFLFARALAYFQDRQLTLGGSWRLASAALMPGALLLTGGILLYGLGVLDLVRLGLVALLHFIVVWVYLILGALALPRIASLPPASANPFATPSE